MIHTHADHLERWLGADAVAGVSRSMRDFYWPIAVAGVPGNVIAMPGGDFTGEIRAGQEMSALDRASDYLRRERRKRITRAGHLRRQAGAFGSLDAVVAAATGGKMQNLFFQKTSVTATASVIGTSLFRQGAMPSAGAAGGAAPGGTALTTANAGAMPFGNPANANTAHFTTGYAQCNQGGYTLLLYDRLFAVAKTMNSTATEAVTGVPTRYTSGTATADDYIGGNFCSTEVGTVLPATAHNWTVGKYTNQASTAGQSFSSIAGVSAAASGTLDIQAGQWFMQLAAGDVGVKALTQMQASALVATGTIDFFLGHPLAWLPCPIANQLSAIDGLYTAFNLVKIFDNACLALLEPPKPAAAGGIYFGQITLVAE